MPTTPFSNIIFSPGGEGAPKQDLPKEHSDTRSKGQGHGPRRTGPAGRISGLTAGSLSGDRTLEGLPGE